MSGQTPVLESLCEKHLENYLQMTAYQKSGIQDPKVRCGTHDPGVRP